MKRNVKNVFKVMLVVLMIASIFRINIVDASVVTNETGYTFSGDINGYSFENEPIEWITKDGKTCFSLEPWKSVESGEGYNSSFVGCDEMLEGIIAYWFREGATLTATPLNYAITQIAIWEYLYYSDIETTIPNGDYLIADILWGAEFYFTLPTFHNEMIQLDEYSSVKLTSDVYCELSAFYYWDCPEGIEVEVYFDYIVIRSTGGLVEDEVVSSIRGWDSYDYYIPARCYAREGSASLVAGYTFPCVTTELTINVVDVVEPEYATLTSTKTASETVNVALTKTDVDNDKTLSNATFDFYRDDVLFASDVVSNTSGVASATYTDTHSYSTDTYTYCTNYDDLYDSGKAKVETTGAYTSKDLAQAQADKDAQAGADALASKTHTYKVVETASKTAYYLDASNSTVSSSITGSGDVNFDMSSQRILGTATLDILDKETGANAQGGATLEGAEFGLFAYEDILDPADNSVVYTAGTKVSEVTIANGTAKVENLYLGNYYWQELKAPTGYTLNEEQYNFALTQNENEPIVSTSNIAENEVIKGYLEVVSNASIETSVTFSVFSLSTGENVDTVVANNSYVRSNLLPYDTYEVIGINEDGVVVESFEIDVEENEKGYLYSFDLNEDEDENVEDELNDENSISPELDEENEESSDTDDTITFPEQESDDIVPDVTVTPDTGDSRCIGNYLILLLGSLVLGVVLNYKKTEKIV